MRLAKERDGTCDARPDGLVHTLYQVYAWGRLVTPASTMREKRRQLGDVAEGTNSARRILEVLRDFAEPPHEFRSVDVARKHGMSPSTASRIFAILCESGFCERDAVTGLYRLGLQLVTLSSAALSKPAIYREGQPVAQRLAVLCGLGTNIAVPMGQQIFYLATFDGIRSSRRSSMAGQHAEMHCTALGKAMLLDAEVATLGNLSLTQHTIHTKVTVEDLAMDLESARQRGYAKEDEESALGRACIAVPIRSSTGTIVGALSISGPASDFADANQEALLSRQLQESVDGLSGAIV